MINQNIIDMIQWQQFCSHQVVLPIPNISTNYDHDILFWNFF